jgi:hypothetical protein
MRNAACNPRIPSVEDIFAPIHSQPLRPPAADPLLGDHGLHTLGSLVKFNVVSVCEQTHNLLRQIQEKP